MHVEAIEIIPDPSQVKQVLSLSDERDHWETLVDQAFRRGFQCGHDAGFARGYAQRDTDEAVWWRELARPIAHPDAYRQECARRNLTAAEAGCRRDAAEQERIFIARAYATQNSMRTDAQAAAVLCYPPNPP